MFVRRSIRIAGAYLSAIVLTLAIATVGVCQTAPKEDSESTYSEPIEEVVVYGEKSLGRLRHEKYLAEVNLFDVFNSITDNDEYDIDCERVIPLGSRKVRHVCMPEFARKYEADSASAFIEELQGIGAGPPAGNWAVVQSKEKLLIKEMAELAIKDPRMRKAFVDLARATHIYESERQRRCEGRFLCKK